MLTSIRILANFFTSLMTIFCQTKESDPDPSYWFESEKMNSDPEGSFHFTLILFLFSNCRLKISLEFLKSNLYLLVHMYSINKLYCTIILYYITGSRLFTRWKNNVLFCYSVCTSIFQYVLQYSMCTYVLLKSRDNSILFYTCNSGCLPNMWLAI